MSENSKPSRDELVRRIAIASSVLVGLSLAYGVYVLLLQTTAISLRQLAIGVVLFVAAATANYFLTTRILNDRLKRFLRGRIYAISLCLLLPLLFLPLFYITPNYPINPLLRAWTDIRIQYDVRANSHLLQFSAADVLLQRDQDTLDGMAFTEVGVWNSGKGTFALNPGETAALHWAGTASDNVRLTVKAPPASGILTIYWDESRTDLELTAGATKQFILIKKFTTPWGVGACLNTAAYVLFAWLLLLLAVLFDGNIKFTEWMEEAGKRRVLLAGLVIVLALGLALVTVKLQLDSLDGGADTYIHGAQLQRHNDVIQGQAPNPWQYRVFSEYAAEGLIRVFQVMKVRDAIGYGFISLRILQNLVIFLLAFALYRKVSNSNVIAITGLLLLASSMKNAFYDNDLSFNTYFDLIFYLLAVILILQREYWWIVLVTAVAAFNRETSGLIPFLALAKLVDEPWSRLKKAVLFVAPAAAFAAIFAGLHLLYTNRPLYIPYGQMPGLPMLIYNVTRSFTWEQIFHTLGLVPVIGLLFIFKWPRLWQRFFLVLCPAWFAIHFALSLVEETRLFLVPQAVIFIPGALFALNYLWNYDKMKGQIPAEASL